MSIHIQTWSGSRTARVVDMTNAGKRGKRCAKLVFIGSPEVWLTSGNAAMHAAAERTTDILSYLEGDAQSQPFALVYCRIREMIQEFVRGTPGVPDFFAYLRCWTEDIRGVDAPRALLTAGVADKWEAKADEGGITLHDLDDPYNEWTELTPPSQSGAAAYAIAKKVWKQVKAATTLHEAATILRAAGAKLHGFCAVD